MASSRVEWYAFLGSACIQAGVAAWTRRVLVLVSRRRARAWYRRVWPSGIDWVDHSCGADVFDSQHGGLSQVKLWSLEYVKGRSWVVVIHGMCILQKLRWGMPEPCPADTCGACWICYDCSNPECQCTLPDGMKNCKNLPAEMKIDYIRVYQDEDDPTHTVVTPCILTSWRFFHIIKHLFFPLNLPWRSAAPRRIIRLRLISKTIPTITRTGNLSVQGRYTLIMPWLMPLRLLLQCSCS